MTRGTRTIGAWCLGIAMAGVTGCGEGIRGPVAPTPVSPPMTAAPTPPPGADSWLEVSGTVTAMTPDGPVPISGAYVEVCGFDSAWTDDHGFYRLSSVPSNTPLIFVQKAGYRAQSVALSPRGGRLDVRLEREY